MAYIFVLMQLNELEELEEHFQMQKSLCLDGEFNGYCLIQFSSALKRVELSLTEQACEISR